MQTFDFLQVETFRCSTSLRKLTCSHSASASFHLSFFSRMIKYHITTLNNFCIATFKYYRRNTLLNDCWKELESQTEGSVCCCRVLCCVTCYTLRQVHSDSMSVKPCDVLHIRVLPFLVLICYIVSEYNQSTQFRRNDQSNVGKLQFTETNTSFRYCTGIPPPFHHLNSRRALKEDSKHTNNALQHIQVIAHESVLRKQKMIQCLFLSWPV